MELYCASDSARFDCGCAYARDAGLRSAPEPHVRVSQRDERVRAVVALDPALGPGHDAAALSAISVPVHVVGAVQNDFLPFAQHAGRYASLIPGASLTRLTSGEGHFVFLNQRNRDVTVHGVPLYRDRPGINRAGVHARLAGIVLDFLDEQLRVRRGLGALAVG